MTKISPAGYARPREGAQRFYVTIKPDTSSRPSYYEVHGVGSRICTCDTFELAEMIADALEQAADAPEIDAKHAKTLNECLMKMFKEHDQETVLVDNLKELLRKERVRSNSLESRLDAEVEEAEECDALRDEIDNARKLFECDRATAEVVMGERDKEIVDLKEELAARTRNEAAARWRYVRDKIMIRVYACGPQWCFKKDRFYGSTPEDAVDKAIAESEVE